MPQQRKLDEEDSLRRYAQLVRRIIRPYYLQGGDYDDLYQEGMVGLLRAVRRYDPERGAGFEAFASVCIRRQVIDALRREASLSERDKKLLELTPDTAPDSDPELLYLANESAKEITEHLSGLLSAFEASVLDLYLGGQSTAEIAARLGRNAKSVDNAIGRIRRKLAQFLAKGDSR
jgi:RNA polymerase sporulation-specific sigma factor